METQLGNTETVQAGSLELFQTIVREVEGKFYHYALNLIEQGKSRVNVTGICIELRKEVELEFNYTEEVEILTLK